MQLESKNKLKLKKNLYKISLLSFIVVVIWIGFEIYFSYTKPEKDEVSTVNLSPVVPNLHTDLAHKLSLRHTILESDLESFKSSLPQKLSDVPEEEIAQTTSLTKVTPSATQSAGFTN